MMQKKDYLNIFGKRIWCLDQLMIRVAQTNLPLLLIHQCGSNLELQVLIFLPTNFESCSSKSVWNILLFGFLKAPISMTKYDGYFLQNTSSGFLITIG